MGEAVTGAEEDFQEAIGEGAVTIGETGTAVEKAGEIGVKGIEVNGIDCIAYWRPCFGKVVRFEQPLNMQIFSMASVASRPPLRSISLEDTVLACFICGNVILFMEVAAYHQWQCKRFANAPTMIGR